MDTSQKIYSTEQQFSTKDLWIMIICKQHNHSQGTVHTAAKQALRCTIVCVSDLHPPACLSQVYPGISVCKAMCDDSQCSFNIWLLTAHPSITMPGGGCQGCRTAGRDRTAETLTELHHSHSQTLSMLEILYCLMQS